MIYTWMADVTNLLQEDCYKKYYNQSPEFRREKADRLFNRSDKALSIGAWALLEMMRKAYGVPEQADYNLSHSGDYVLCSMSDGPEKVQVGCDLETIKETRWKVARRFFCDSEYEKILQANEQEQRDWFYRFWVLKESFMKATRLGMKLGMDQFEIDFAESGQPYLKTYPEMIKETFYYKEYQVELPYKIAVCADCQEFSDELHRIVL